MKKKFILYDIRSQEFFLGRDLDNCYFGKDNSKKFDSYKEAEERLQYESNLATFNIRGNVFLKREIIIMEVYCIENQ